MWRVANGLDNAGLDVRRRFNYIFVAKHLILLFFKEFLTITCLLGHTASVVEVVAVVVVAAVAVVLIISHLVREFSFP